MIAVTRTSPITGVVHTYHIPCNQNQLDRWEAGELIQNVMPHLTADQREFIMTGITADDWLHLFGSADALDREMQDAR